MNIAAKRRSNGSWEIIEGKTYVRNVQRKADIRTELKFDTEPHNRTVFHLKEGRSNEAYVSEKKGLAYGPPYIVKPWLRQNGWEE